MGRRSGSHRENQGFQQRSMLAQEAARLMRDHGIADYRTAKSKAALSLGLSDRGALPSNREIEAALAERNRIFGTGTHDHLLRSLRVTAVELMHELESFNPCLVGPVLSGNVTEHSSIALHLFSEPAELVSMELEKRGIRYQLTHRRCRISRDLNEDFPGYAFRSGEHPVEMLIFPERRKGHAPLSPVDGKPMRRARLREVATLTESQRLPTGT